MKDWHNKIQRGEKACSHNQVRKVDLEERGLGQNEEEAEHGVDR